MPKVVVIGAGIVGTSLADELTVRGWTDVTVLDRGPLFATGGSTSHAPGLVFQTNPSKTMSAFARYTVEKFGALEHPDGWAFNPGRRPRGRHHSGALGGHAPQGRLGRGMGHRRSPADRRPNASSCIRCSTATASSAASTRPPTVWRRRCAPPRRRRGGRAPAGRRSGRTPRCSASSRTAAGSPACDTTPVSSTPTSWSARPVSGEPSSPSRSVSSSRWCRWHISTRGPGRSARLSDATPNWPRPVCRSCATRTRTCTSASTSTASASGPTATSRCPSTWPRCCPTPQASRCRRCCRSPRRTSHRPGAKPPNCCPHWVIRRSKRGSTASSRSPRTACRIMGEHRDLSGFWVAEAVWVTHSAGVAKATAEWIIDGTPSIDVHECDLYRFEDVARSPKFILQTSSQAFVEVYDIIHPLPVRTALRGLRTSPFYARQQRTRRVLLRGRRLGAPGLVRGECRTGATASPMGWHAPSATTGRRDSGRRSRSPRRTGHPRARRHVRHDPADPLRGRGPGAAAFLQRMTTNNVDKSVGSVTYTLLLDETGGIRSDLTVARLAAHGFQVGANGPLDLDWLHRHLPGRTSQLRDITGGTCCIGVWGPLARDLVAAAVPRRPVTRGLQVLPRPADLSRRDPRHHDAGVLRRRARLGDLHQRRIRRGAVGSALCERRARTTA